MRMSNVLDKPLFDQGHAIDILESFYRVSGLGVILLVPDKATDRVSVLFAKNACKGKCPHCFSEREDSTDLWTPACQRIHCSAADFADRFGGRYFYQCDEDRIFVAAPVVADAGLAAAMVIGPVHIFEVESSRSAGCDLAPFPVRDPAYVEYLSNLLAASAVSVSGSSQAHLRQMKKISMDQQREIHGAIARSKQSKVREYPILLEDELANAIQEADSVSAHAHLNEIIGQIMASYLSKGAYSMAERAGELLTICGRAALRAGVSSEVVLESSAAYRGEVARLKNDEAVAYCLQRYVDHMVYLVSRLHEVDLDDGIYLAIECIRANYNKKIGLEDVASEVGYSPTYFSKLFKKKMGVKFNTYLNQVRIDAAKSSLLSTELTIFEIAGLSGYEDVSYFTRTFKRVVGVTPGYYRSHRGQIDKTKERG